MSPSPHKLLIVDDEKTIHSLIKCALDNRQVQLFHAYNGEDGLQLFHALKPSLMLLDIDMPIMDGIQVMQHIDAKAKERHPIIAMSGADADNRQRQCLDLGARMFMGKPFKILELIGIVNFFIS